MSTVSVLEKNRRNSVIYDGCKTHYKQPDKLKKTIYLAYTYINICELCFLSETKSDVETQTYKKCLYCCKSDCLLVVISFRKTRPALNTSSMETKTDLFLDRIFQSF